MPRYSMVPQRRRSSAAMRRERRKTQRASTVNEHIRADLFEEAAGGEGGRRSSGGHMDRADVPTLPAKGPLGTAWSWLRGGDPLHDFKVALLEHASPLGAAPRVARHLHEIRHMSHHRHHLT